jgi:hypothetical protein
LTCTQRPTASTSQASAGTGKDARTLAQRAASTGAASTKLPIRCTRCAGRPAPIRKSARPRLFTTSASACAKREGV